MTEIRVQRKTRRSKKWAWLLLLLIPAVWFALQKGGPEGGDEGAADSTRSAATSADSGRTKPADTTAKADSTKPPR